MSDYHTPGVREAKEFDFGGEMLIPHVAKVNSEDAGQSCECCLCEPAEIKLEHEDEFYLCAECAMQIARAFMKDLCALLPDYRRAQRNPSPALTKRTVNKCRLGN
jgi:hypothetical protein